MISLKLRTKILGFSLIELIVVIGIIGVVATVGFLNIFNFGSENDLDLTVREIVSVLRNAQDRSISQEGGVQWGVYFENSDSDSFYVLYKGATTTFISKKNLRFNIQFLEPSVGNNKDVSFFLVSGLPVSSTTIQIALKNDSSKVRRISVNSNGQIGFSLCPNSAQDADGNIYNTVIINNQCWLKENLRRGTRIAGSSEQTNNSTVEKYCYNDIDSNCATDGGLYQWDEAMNYSATEGAQGICPTGWHIPTDTEQYNLENYLKDSGQTCSATRSMVWDCDTAGTKLKSDGSSGFEGLLAGLRYTASPWFSDLGASAIFWSSTQSGSNAWYRGLFSVYTTVVRRADTKAYGFSVRCLKD